MTRTRTRRATALVVVAGLALLAGCGSTVSSTTSVVNGGTPSTSVSPTEGSGAVDASCPTPAATPATAAARSVRTADGATRTYATWTPPGYAGTSAAPLLLLFHGTGGTPQGIADFTGLVAAATARGYVVAAPQATNGPVGATARWTVPGYGATPDDVAFTRLLVEDVAGTYCVNPDRVYGTGFSSGGAFTQHLACEAPTLFAALAPIAGANLIRDCPSAEPVPWLSFHGTADEIVSYTGFSSNLADPDSPYFGDVDETTAATAARNGCSPVAAETVVGPRVSKRTFSGCEAETTLYVMRDAGHTFPGSTVSAAGDEVPGDTVAEFDGAATILDFFDAQSRTD